MKTKQKRRHVVKGTPMLTAASDEKINAFVKKEFICKTSTKIEKVIIS